MPSSAPKRILVTRSRSQNSELAAQLKAVGAEPILIPTISIGGLESYAALDAAIEGLRTFDWLVFTSANAVAAFAERGFKLQQTTRDDQPFRVAAIGSATARALTGIGLPPDLLPAQAVAESLAEALLPRIIPRQTRILLVRAVEARDTLPNSLRHAGADLTIAPAYRNVIPSASIPALRSIFQTPGSWPDAITFTSSSTAANLFSLLEVAGIGLPADGRNGHTILRASIGPVTSQTLRDLGYPPHIQASEPTIASLVQALMHRLNL